MIKKKKLSSNSGGKMSTREKMLKRKEELQRRGEKGAFIFIKEGTLRMRIKSQGSDAELGLELIQFYLGKDLGSITSPATFNEPCPFMEKYKKLKDSSKESDKKLAALLVPKKKYVIGGFAYKDEKGKEVDPDKTDKAFLITGSIYQDIVDLYLDEDEWGDMTDPSEGYDVKITRSGSGKNDTTYSVSPCQRKPIPQKLKGTIDLESIVRSQIKSYDELEEILENYLNSADTDESEEEDTPRKSKGLTKKPLKKKSSRDI